MQGTKSSEYELDQALLRLGTAAGITVGSISCHRRTPNFGRLGLAGTSHPEFTTVLDTPVPRIGAEIAVGSYSTKRSGIGRLTTSATTVIDALILSQFALTILPPGTNVTLLDFPR